MNKPNQIWNSTLNDDKAKYKQKITDISRSWCDKTGTLPINFAQNDIYSFWIKMESSGMLAIIPIHLIYSRRLCVLDTKITEENTQKILIFFPIIANFFR